jgi:hypothetical protein
VVAQFVEQAQAFGHVRVRPGEVFLTQADLPSIVQRVRRAEAVPGLATSPQGHVEVAARHGIIFLVEGKEAQHERGAPDRAGVPHPA